MKHKTLNIKFLILFHGLYIIGYAQSNDSNLTKKYIAYKTPIAINIDGEALDKSWNKIDWSDLFIDIQGTKQPKYKTQFKMLWDDSYFYILANLKEPHVWGDLIKRDTVIFHNNDFEIFIDPDGNGHNYYELEINALNTPWDLFITKPYREPSNMIVNDWNITGLKSAVKVNGTINNSEDIDDGWILEMAIPWEAFKTEYFKKNIPVDTFWRINFSRVNWDFQITDGKYERKKDDNGKLLKEHNWVWSPMGVINMHEPEKWGYVYFSSKKAGDHDDFIIPDDEKIKWNLFKFYRDQKAYFKTNKKWATSIDSLQTDAISLDGKILSPTLENHSEGWNIIIESPFTGKQLVIKEDGEFISK